MTDRRRDPGQRDDPQDNPFAPPPEDQPDRPWRPRHQDGDDARAAGDADGEGDQRQRWGSYWSRRQPGRQSGGFGAPPPGRDGRRGGGLGNHRWDPTDPGQRHARYAVLAGMWGVFAGLLGWEWLGLLLGALALYWGISGLRGGPKREGRENGRDERGDQPQGGAAPAPAAGKGRRPGDRPQFAAAVAGVVLASAALAIVIASYTVHLVYKDYYDCREDALTTPSRQSCEELLPSRLRPLLGEED